MKTPISYFLVALTALSVAAGERPVYDMDGNIIKTSGWYYVLPFTGGQGGGLTLAGRGDKPCPLDIVQESSEIDQGFPVQFFNWKSGAEFILHNTVVNIETKVAGTICRQPTYWWMYKFIGHDMDHWFLTTGPEPDEYKHEWYKSLFTIIETDEKYVYEIMFCPLGNALWPYCGGLEIFVNENGVPRLRLGSTKPFLVQFKKDNMIDSVLSKNM